MYMRLFAIGSALAELIVNLKQSTEERPLIDQLHRDFGNLRDVCRMEDVSAIDALIQPVLDRFCSTLAEVSAKRDALQEKCDQLIQRLEHFLDPPPPRSTKLNQATDGFDDIPF